MYKNKDKDADQGEAFMLDGMDFMQNTNRVPTAFTTTLSIFDTIGSVSNYTQHLQALKSASPNDNIHIQIASYGGSLDTTVAILNAMRECQGTITTEIISNCASAATFIFLAGDQFIVQPNIEFMVHNYSSGYIGKGGEITAKVMFEDDLTNKLMEQCYKNFLTEDEIAEVRKGVDFYFNDEQLIERVEKLYKAREAENQANLREYITVSKDFLEKCINEAEYKEDIMEALMKKLEEEVTS